MAAPAWPQQAMAGVWAALAAPCLFAPEVVLHLCVREHARAPAAAPAPGAAGKDSRATERLLMRCFGAQAAVTALLLGTARLDRAGYRVFALAMLPFFAFDVAALRGGYLTRLGAAGDALGNAAFVALAAAGAGLLGGT